MRRAIVERETRETKVSVEVNLDGSGESIICTPSKFLSHMLNSLSVHSGIDVTIQASGDLLHHIIEDIAIVFGQAFRQALGDGTGIQRFGSALVPMDCSLAQVVLDLVRRSYYVANIPLERRIIEDIPTEDIKHFLETFAHSACFNLHILVQYGKNDHHKVEAVFKALALSLREGISVQTKEIPSAKGVL
ncbi:MAG: imidazoleglycerol-phosphate dehydratase HisB [Candidatus Lokiarchaeota archaeon]|nr:imidazoleglycerol-phosphate dehydratase HisB [Candidatus Lokiarchaeota archaeon]